jgi:crotonobetainyl-CoA:carnitine CoA-transferase CaiB-like acyl-CoA transferase
MILADLGADVVKIEDPRLGDYMRAIPGGRFAAVNRDKRSAALDLKNPTHREAFLRMVERADVVVESFRPGVMAKLGVGWDVLVARNPKIVLCSISGYGQDGPYRDRAGHDLNYIGIAGVLAMTGPTGGAPQMPGVQIADLAGGALWGAIGVLGALLDGGGKHLDISMTEGAMALLAPELASAGTPTRGSETLNGGLACYGVYACKDGWLSVGALEPKFWLAFNQAIGRPGDMGELIAPAHEQARVRAEVQAILSTKTRAEWVAIFKTVDVCCEPILETSELAEHPLHVARQVFFAHDGVRQMRLPVGAPQRRRGAPSLGQHTAEVLAEYGITLDELG